VPLRKQKARVKLLFRNVIYIALLFFVGLTINSKSGIDRAIYGALAAAAVTALIYYRGVPIASPWSF
jgi:hypothetical protein